MKYLKLEYPNKKIHNIIVKELGINEDSYFITYYDLTEHKEKHSLLIKENDTYKKSNTITENEITKLKENYNELNPNILPKIIKCIKNENNNVFLVYQTKQGMYLKKDLAQKFDIKNNYQKQLIQGQICIKVTEDDISNIENENQKAFYKIINNNKKEFFTVYTIKDQFYIPEDLCKIYNINYNDNIKYIKNQRCYNVSKKDINNIENENLCATYTKIFQPQKELSFIVYKTEDGLYILKELCEKFNIEKNNIQIIEGYKCYKVTEDDIATIEKLTINKDPKLKARYRHTSIKKEHFNVLKINNELYIEENLKKYLNNEQIETKTYKNNKYIKVNDNIIKELENTTNKKAIYTEIKQKEAYFIVYEDSTNLYIDEYIAKLFRLNNNKSLNINNKIYIQVNQKDINNIEILTKNLDTKLKAKYIEKK